MKLSAAYFIAILMCFMTPKTQAQPRPTMEDVYNLLYPIQNMAINAIQLRSTVQMNLTKKTNHFYNLKEYQHYFEERDSRRELQKAVKKQCEEEWDGEVIWDEFEVISQEVKKTKSYSRDYSGPNYNTFEKVKDDGQFIVLKKAEIPREEFYDISVTTTVKAICKNAKTPIANSEENVADHGRSEDHIGSYQHVQFANGSHQ